MHQLQLDIQPTTARANRLPACMRRAVPGAPIAILVDTPEEVPFANATPVQNKQLYRKQTKW